MTDADLNGCLWKQFKNVVKSCYCVLVLIKTKYFILISHSSSIKSAAVTLLITLGEGEKAKQESILMISSAVSIYIIDQMFVDQLSVDKNCQLTNLPADQVW